MYGKLLTQFRDCVHGEGRLGYIAGKSVTTLSTQPFTRDTPYENNVVTDGEYSGCEIDITPSPMSTKPPRKQPRKRVIISSSTTLPTRPSSGISTTHLISAYKPTCFTQAPLYSTALSTPPTSPLSLSAANTPATRAARTSTRVRKRQTSSFSPGHHPYHQLLSTLHLQLLQQPNLAVIRLHVNFPVSLQPLLHIFPQRLPATTGTVVFPGDHISLPISFFPTCLQTTVGPHRNSHTDAYA